MTLGLRRAQRLANIAADPRVNVIEADLEDPQSVAAAVAGQDLVFGAVADHDRDNAMTQNVIAAMQQHHVQRVIFTNILGLYNEVPGEFGLWNLAQVRSGLAAAQRSDQLLADSDLTYTTLRLPWLNDRPEVKYTVTSRDGLTSACPAHAKASPIPLTPLMTASAWPTPTPQEKTGQSTKCKNGNTRHIPRCRFFRQISLTLIMAQKTPAISVTYMIVGGNSTDKPSAAHLTTMSQASQRLRRAVRITDR